jgi:SAM-dependent methyltransferase
VQPSPHSSADVEAIYRNRFAANLDYRKQIWTLLASQFFSRWIRSSDAVIDIGCGYCEFINNIAAARKYGIDLNPASRSNAAAGVTLFEQDCVQRWPLPPGSLDVAFSSNFFEHLPSKQALEATLLEALRCLKSGGRLIAMGPNIRYVGGAYWDFFDHYLPLTDRSLVEVLTKCGFETELVEPRFLPFTMSHGRNAPLWMVRIYLALPLAWRFFGKQFLVIARKPALTPPRGSA